MKTKVIWYLFDSDLGAGKTAFNLWKENNNYQFYSIGLSSMGSDASHHFISCDLSQTLSVIVKELATLPIPDIILASPPCESWCNAKAPFYPYWVNTNPLLEKHHCFDEMTKEEYEAMQDFYHKKWGKKRLFEPKFEKLIPQYRMGKTLIAHTFDIIHYYQKKNKNLIYLIENGACTHIWEYIETVLKEKVLYSNLTHYGAYNEYPIKKPTKFAGNIKLNLKLETKEQGEIRRKRTALWINENDKSHKLKWHKHCGGLIKQGYLWRCRKDSEVCKALGTYAKRSNIPTNLLIDIYNQIDKKLNS